LDFQTSPQLHNCPRNPTTPGCHKELVILNLGMASPLHKKWLSKTPTCTCTCYMTGRHPSSYSGPSLCLACNNILLERDQP